jgi:hypothetical protein
LPKGVRESFWKEDVFEIGLETCQVKMRVRMVRRRGDEEVHCIQRSQVQKHSLMEV